MNGMMAERGFPLENLESTLKKLEKNESFENAMESQGDGYASNPVDELKKVAKADIWMQLTYNVNRKGPRSSVQFNLQGLDAYTNKQIATAVGNGEPSSGSVPELMEEAVLAHLDNFNSTLMTYFDDMFENGREVTLKIKVRDDWGEDLYTYDYGDDELMVVIEDMIYDLTKNHVYSLEDYGDYYMDFDQCRIPIFKIDKRGREKAYNATAFGNDVRKSLREIGIPSRLGPQAGLGTVTVIIGDK